MELNAMFFKKFVRHLKVAAATPDIKVADTTYNTQQILSLMKKAEKEDVQLLVLPELCITGSTCGDLFLQDTLLDASHNALNFLAKESQNTITVVGLPMRKNGKLYNMAAVLYQGSVLGYVPKTHTDRVFSAAKPEETNILFRCKDFTFAVELCDDLWVPNPPSISHALAGATVIANLSANNETVGKVAYRRSLVSGQSARLVCGYIYSNAGYGESTTDTVFSGHNLICENGIILSESPAYGSGWAVSEIDLPALDYDRRQTAYFQTSNGDYQFIDFPMEVSSKTITRTIERFPFIPSDTNDKSARCEEILAIQAAGLKKRLEFTDSKKAVIGVSGGLDSTLALLSTARLTKDIEAITMPCFGTTERTKRNAHALCEALGIPCREIDIKESVTQHLKDIKHDSKTDIVYENAQARMRTYVLMDIANKVNGLVIGTGSLSELALGWATFNGDHMSMYALNSGLPKTLIRQIVKHIADNSTPPLSSVLYDILDTPISPELLPDQRTEDMVGPYELHDFFMYHILRYGRKPSEIYQLACLAFDRNADEILDWLKVFCRRFFSQQFKRNCLPDGPMIGSVNLSPRGKWQMPSDAMVDEWIRELEGDYSNISE